MTDNAATAAPALRLSMGEAATEAFRYRGRRGVLIGATVAYYVLALIVSVTFFTFAWRGYFDYLSWVFHMVGKPGGQGPAFTPPPASVFSVLAALPLFIAVYSIVLATYEAACLKWMLREESGGFFGLSLGGDTWRVWATYWVWLALYILLGIGAAFLVAAFALGLGAAHANEPLIALFALIGVVTIPSVLIWIGVRLAPAAATTIALKRFAFFEALKATKGKFWTLFGAYLLIFAAFYAVELVIEGLSFPVVFGPMSALFARTASGGAPPTGEEIIGLFTTPTAIAGLTAVSLAVLAASALFRLALMGVSARAVLVAQQDGKV